MRKFAFVFGAVLLLGVSHWHLRDDETDSAGYVLLALAWTPSWCALEGAARNAPRCAAGSQAGWLVHGLWPQHDDGTWPEFCAETPAVPHPAILNSMVDIMGSSGLAAYQWRKHGTCSGRRPEEYFSDTRKAFERLHFPEQLAPRQAQRLSPEAILTDFRLANPQVGADMAVLTCRDGLLHEIRLCMTPELKLRTCDSRTLRRGCRMEEVYVPPKP